MMDTRELARWISQEHGRVEELSSALRDTVSHMPKTHREPWIAELRDVFERFHAHMLKHMALEEHEGYLTPVIEAKPSLGAKAERLHHEHREFERLMGGIRELLANVTPADRLLVRDCCRRIGDLLDYVSHHENRENVLLIDAFCDDIGTKD
jgi:iron-sulfur cluster repair protein YtfE (RIC family)